MRTVKLHRFVSSLALAAGLILAGAHDREAHAADKSGNVPLPAHTIQKGDQCVEPVEVMRRDHMKFILHQRDKTMHQGIRTTRHSLTNCVDCHADTKTGSVLGKEGFCESCHAYAAVKIDCFECHSSLRQASATKNSTTTAPSTVRAFSIISQKNTGESAGTVFPPKGKKP